MHKNIVVLIPAEGREEAHYLCAVLNSAVTDFIARSYSVGKSFGSPHLLEQVAIPSFDSDSPLHQRLATLSQQAHALAAQPMPDEPGLEKVEREIDQAAAELWGLTEAESKEIRQNLEELG
jgi:ribosome recycling factor